MRVERPRWLAPWVLLAAAVPVVLLAAPARGEGDGGSGREAAPDAGSEAEAVEDGAGGGDEERSPPERVQLLLDRPAPTPFSLIRYEIVRRDRATTAVHHRSLPGHSDALHGMGLLEVEQAERVWRTLRETSALALEDAVPEDLAPDARVWRVRVTLDGETNAFRVADPINRDDRRYQRLVRVVREVARREGGAHPFRNVFYPSGRMGWVNILSVPAADVWIDGFDTGEETPLYSYEVEAGTHEVRLKSLDGEYERTYEIEVAPSGHTRLDVDLR